MGGKRIEWVDVSKVLVIWLMVLGHILEKSGIDAVVRNMIYSFHMPFFFLVSGFLHKNKSPNFWQYTLANAKSLLVPYIFLRLCSFLLLISYIVFTKLDISNYLMDFISGGGNSPGGASWFLLCFFCVKELYYFLDKLPLNLSWLLVLCLVFVSFFLPYRLFWNLDAALMAMPFYMIGTQYKAPISKNMVALRSNVVINVILFISLFLVFLFSGLQGNVSLYDTIFGNYPLLFYPCAIIGVGAVLLLAKQFHGNPFIETFSKGTIVIMGLHGALYPYMMLVYRVLVRPLLSPPINLICEIAISIIIVLLLYYPIIWLQRYVPFLIGNRR